MSTTMPPPLHSPLLRPPTRASFVSNPGGNNSQLSGSPVTSRPRGLSLGNKHPTTTSIISPPSAYNPPPAVESSKRKRSSSIVSVQEIHTTYDEALDQEALSNINADWVNFKGAWIIHLLLIGAGKILIDIIPGMSQTLSWTITLQTYLMITFLIFHWVTGTPFSANGGAYDRITFWEQIDKGAQNTPTRKFLTTLPIMLFLLTTHYARYDLHPAFFTLNLASLLLFALAPKLPQAHLVRLRFFDSDVDNNASGSYPNSDRSRAPSPQPPRIMTSSPSTEGQHLTELNVRELNLVNGGPSGSLPSPIPEESETPTVGSPVKPSKKWHKFAGLS